MKEIVYICKGCGRGIRTNVPPNYCYFDRLDHLENICDEDAVRMGIFSFGKSASMEGAQIEFPGDFKFSPFTGKEEKYVHHVLKGFTTLSELQDELFKQVIG